MKKVFFSQRFHDKDEEDIFEEREALRQYFDVKLGMKVDIIDQYHIEPPKDAVPTYNWSQDLLLLGEADLIVFCHDWEEALGCQMEMLACKKYELPFMIIPEIQLYGKALRALEKYNKTRGGC